MNKIKVEKEYEIADEDLKRISKADLIDMFIKDLIKDYGTIAIENINIEIL